MSTDVLKLIPSAPEFVPNEGDIEKLKEWIEKCKAQIIITEELRFIDQGENFKSISCPLCNGAIDIEWWQEAMTKTSKTSFQNLYIGTPCCNKNTSLNELQYKWNAGFARFSMEIIDPVDDITEQELTLVEKHLQCKIRKIFARY